MSPNMAATTGAICGSNNRAKWAMRIILEFEHSREFNTFSIVSNSFFVILALPVMDLVLVVDSMLPVTMERTVAYSIPSSSVVSTIWCLATAAS